MKVVFASAGHRHLWAHRFPRQWAALSARHDAQHEERLDCQDRSEDEIDGLPRVGQKLHDQPAEQGS
jgi:hypothetical protein